MTGQSAIRAIYHGRVQGVGFRYTCQKIAGRHPVAGYVRNQSDGTVELVVQGANTAVDAFLHDIRQAFSQNITDVQIQTISPDETLTHFTIRR